MAEKEEYRSHLEMVIRNPDVNLLLENIVNQLGSNGWDLSRLNLNPDEVALATEAYKQEVMNGQTELHQLTLSLLDSFWKNADIKTTMNIKGICMNKRHRGIVSLNVGLGWDQILRYSDEELTISLLPPCPTCKTDTIKPLESYIVHIPSKPKARSVIDYATRRSKAAGNLAEKLTDRILGVENLTRPDRIPVGSGGFIDLYGIRFITRDRDGCYKAMKMIRERSDLVVLQEKDYIENPKGNNYKSLHLYVGANGLLYELQIRDLIMHSDAEANRDISHKAYSEKIREARKSIGEPWDNLYLALTQLLGVPEEKRII
jgi:putative GTP pyrophosphokinase